MNYYKVAVPLNVANLYTYKSEKIIDFGVRILINFNNAIYTGIVIDRDDNISAKIKYSAILEIIDKESIISSELLKFAKWISIYYQSSLGIVLSAIIPGALNVQFQQRVKKLKDAVLPESNGISEQILLQLSKLAYTDVADIKGTLNITRFYYWLERLEEKGIIEIERKFDKKLKDKVANFIIDLFPAEIPKLTIKQEELYQKIKEIGVDFKLSLIAKKYSYSIVKSLRNKGLIKIEPRVVKEKRDDPFKIDNLSLPKQIILTSEQENVISKLNEQVQKEKFSAYLLYGVTGSGKTEIYLNIIKSVLEKGKSAILLLPEISLTPQILSKFYSKFGDQIAVIHSHLSEREKYLQWKSINSGESKIVIGARSAIFAPMKNIGIIIVDEEHETSYKQDKNPRYNARDIAVVRAKMNDALVILGTATPSLETWYNVNKGNYGLLTLKRRPSNISMPDISIVDMRKQKPTTPNFSIDLINAIEERLKKKEQIILFQNRRAYSSFVQCVACGKLFECPNCEISLHYHTSSNELKCHYCGYTEAVPRKCPDCGSYLFNFGAPGTQQIEAQIKALFPKAKLLRMDSDSTSRKNSYKEMFERMKSGDVDILLGTQMISKGLDFHNVTLVGVISADVTLNFPDFRSAERTFQLLTQVAGRSGRGEKTGNVIIQTYNPEHYSIVHSLNQNFELFAIDEMKFRRTLKYPPYYRMARIVFTYKNYEFLNEQLENNRQLFMMLERILKNDLQILGPIATPIPKIRNEYRVHIILKAKSPSVISKAINYINDHLKISSVIKKSIDIDPYSLL